MDGRTRRLYDAVMETAVIELTEQQLQAIENSEATSPRRIDPRLKEGEYDDSPWTREELEALAWEAGRQAGWDDMDEYDDLPETP